MKLSQDMVAVVTGAASGIGLALARNLASRGLKLALADLDATRLLKAAETLRETGCQVIEHVCDIAEKGAVDDLRDRALSQFGRTDLVCNNAGMVLPFRPMWEHSHDEWRRIIDVNLWGVIHGIAAFAPLLIEQRRGHILNTASMAGVSVIPYNGPYNATKHAVVSLTETLAGELAECAPEVGASVLCVGRVNTNIGGKSIGGRTREMVGPSGEAAMEPEPVAQAALAGVEAGQLYIFTNSGSKHRIETRVTRLLADADR